MADSKDMLYIGPTGAGLGFALSGLAVEECETGERLVDRLRQLKEQGSFSIIFVDEGLAQPVLSEVEALNEDPVPAIVLLVNPTKPINLTQEKMRNLTIKAVGSDIFNK